MIERDAKRLKDMCHIHRHRDLPEDIMEKYETAANLLADSAAAKSGLSRETLVQLVLTTKHTIELEKKRNGEMVWMFDGEDLTSDPRELERIKKQKAEERKAKKIEREAAPKE